MQKAFAIPPDRFQLLPNAVDMDVASDVQPAAEPGRGSRIITVARLNEWGKGVGQVIGAMPLILANIPDAEYVIVGDGAIRGELEKLAREYGVESRVRFAGRVSDEELGRLYRGSAVFAMPSIKEGFGIVYLEAWKHRLPVVAGNRDASPEVVDDGVNGLVVDPGSHEQIARAITHLLVDQEYARQLGQNGYEKLRAEYSHEAFHARLQRILLGLRC
jgi:glycosyltransferase involved in cell wall biosynthesis